MSVAGTPSSPTHGDQQAADGDANAADHKPAKKMGAKERKKIAAMKAQQGTADADPTVPAGPAKGKLADTAPAPAKDKLADKQRQAATAAEGSSTIAAHRPAPAAAAKGKAQAPTEAETADDKGKRPMQPKATPQSDAKRAKLQAAASSAAASSDDSDITVADAEAQPVANSSPVAQLAEPDADAGEDWIVAGAGKKKRGAAAKDADAASPSGDITHESAPGSPVAQPELQPNMSKRERKRLEKAEKKRAAAALQANSAASPNHKAAAPAAAADDAAAPADQAAALPPASEDAAAEVKFDSEQLTSILRQFMPVYPPTRKGVLPRNERRSSGDWQPEVKQLIQNKPMPRTGNAKGIKVLEGPLDNAQQPKENPVLKKILPGKPQPRKKRAIAEAKSANADSADGKQC